MGRIEEKIAESGLILPPALVPPGGVALPFRFVAHQMYDVVMVCL